MANTLTKVLTGDSMKAALLRQEGVLIVMLVVALVVLSTQTGEFLTTANLLNQGRWMPEVGLMALPMPFVMVTGGIDLSVGSILGLCAIMTGYSWHTLGLPL